MKNGYRKGRPKGVKSDRVARKWNTEEEKQALWQQAEKKIEELGYKGNNNKPNSSIYKTWYVNLQPEDIDDVSNEDLLEIIYKYKGNKHLWQNRTKEDDFDGVYNSQYKYGKK